MLTISQVATRYHINNRQVYDLVEYGYLQVSQVLRNANGGLSYLFAEEDLASVDVYSLLADLQAKQARLGGARGRTGYSRVIRAMNHYDRFLENIAGSPQENLLKTCFYLFHLNHYAKTYPDRSRQLYSLKNRVIRKMWQENREAVQCRYLLGPDRRRIWLCDDCKDSARSAGMSFVEYLKKGYSCPNCFIQSVEPEYYSLVEFEIVSQHYRFVFHIPRVSARRWMNNLEDLPQLNRETGQDDDQMYLYGRRATRVEEKSFPLGMVVEALTRYLTPTDE